MRKSAWEEEKKIRNIRMRMRFSLLLIYCVHNIVRHSDLIAFFFFLRDAMCWMMGNVDIDWNLGGKIVMNLDLCLR